jgi:hypothetical protein
MIYLAILQTQGDIEMSSYQIVTSNTSELNACIEIWEKKLATTKNILERVEILEIITHLHKELYSRGVYETN